MSYIEIEDLFPMYAPLGKCRYDKNIKASAPFSLSFLFADFCPGLVNTCRQLPRFGQQLANTVRKLSTFLCHFRPIYLSSLEHE